MALQTLYSIPQAPIVQAPSVSAGGGQQAMTQLMQLMRLMDSMEYHQMRMENQRDLYENGRTAKERELNAQRQLFNAAAYGLVEDPNFVAGVQQALALSPTNRLKKFEELRTAYMKPLKKKQGIDDRQLYEELLGDYKRQAEAELKEINDVSSARILKDKLDINLHTLWNDIKGIPPWVDSEALAADSAKYEQEVAEQNAYLRDQQRRAQEGESWWDRTSFGGKLLDIVSQAPNLAAFVAPGGAVGLGVRGMSMLGRAVNAAKAARTANLANIFGGAALGQEMSGQSFITSIRNSGASKEEQDAALDSWSALGNRAIGALTGAIAPSLVSPGRAIASGLARAGFTQPASRFAPNTLQQGIVNASRRSFGSNVGRRVADTAAGMAAMSGGQDLATQALTQNSLGRDPFDVDLAQTRDAMIQGFGTGALVGGVTSRGLRRLSQLRDDGTPRTPMSVYAAKADTLRDQPMELNKLAVEMSKEYQDDPSKPGGNDLAWREFVAALGRDKSGIDVRTMYDIYRSGVRTPGDASAPYDARFNVLTPADTTLLAWARRFHQQGVNTFFHRKTTRADQDNLLATWRTAQQQQNDLIEWAKQNNKKNADNFDKLRPEQQNKLLTTWETERAQTREQPEQPAAEEPAQPAAEEPASEEQPAQPEQTAAEQPASEQPASEQPVQPAAEEPAQPAQSAAEGQPQQQQAPYMPSRNWRNVPAIKIHVQGITQDLIASLKIKNPETVNELEEWFNDLHRSIEDYEHLGPSDDNIRQSVIDELKKGLKRTKFAKGKALFNTIKEAKDWFNAKVDILNANAPNAETSGSSEAASGDLPTTGRGAPAAEGTSESARSENSQPTVTDNAAAQGRESVESSAQNDRASSTNPSTGSSERIRFEYATSGKRPNADTTPRGEAPASSAGEPPVEGIRRESNAQQPTDISAADTSGVTELQQEIGVKFNLGNGSVNSFSTIESLYTTDINDSRALDTLLPDVLNKIYKAKTSAESIAMFESMLPTFEDRMANIMTRAVYDAHGGTSRGKYAPKLSNEEKVLKQLLQQAGINFDTLVKEFDAYVNADIEGFASHSAKDAVDYINMDKDVIKNFFRRFHDGKEVSNNSETPKCLQR